MDGIFDTNWGCVSPVIGRYTQCYLDFVPDPASPTGGYLYILNAWMVDDSGTVENPDCYNLFQTVTGSGSERWVIKVYGDQTVWVEKNGVVV